jgi:hypothetical protein
MYRVFTKSGSEVNEIGKYQGILMARMLADMFYFFLRAAAAVFASSSVSYVPDRTVCKTFPPE